MNNENSNIPTLEDDDGIPIGWEDVRLTEEGRDALAYYADRGDVEKAEQIVDGAYDRLFGAQLN